MAILLRPISSTVFNFAEFAGTLAPGVDAGDLLLPPWRDLDPEHDGVAVVVFLMHDSKESCRPPSSTSSGKAAAAVLLPLRRGSAGTLPNPLRNATEAFFLLLYLNRFSN